VPPRWGQVREFCRRQGYRETRTDHFRYLKVLADRSTSGTIISMGVDGEEVPPNMWRLVWKQQLRLAGEDEFWKGLGGEPVQYAVPPAPEPSRPLPEYLERFLRQVLHYEDAEIARTSRAEAQALLNAHYARELREP
jgi:hypothetical protein